MRFKSTRQVLLNLTLRLRERLAHSATQGDRLLHTLQDAVGPVRTCAAAILELEGIAAESPKDALSRMVESLGHQEWAYLPEYLSALREGSPTEPSSRDALVHVHDLTQAMRARVETSPGS